jgi:hypothetical protein
MYTKFLIIFVVGFLALVASASARTCGKPKKNATADYNTNSSFWSRSFKWSDPKRKRFSRSWCLNKCRDTGRCYLWDYHKDNKGAKCEMYPKGTKLLRNAKCSEKRCVDYASRCWN